MIITITNPTNKEFIKFLDQNAIEAEYGAEKITLDTQDFVTDRVLNLYGDSEGDGGLYSLPSNVTTGYSVPFSQTYRRQGNKYNQRTIVLTSSLPAFVIVNNRSVYDLLNKTLLQDDSVLIMEIEDGTRKGYCEVTCEESPLTNESFSFTFKVWGDTVYSFSSNPIVKELLLVGATNELKYPKKYPYKYEEKNDNVEISITNNSTLMLPLNIYIKGGTGTNVKVRNNTTGVTSGIVGNIIQDDSVVILAGTRTVLKNGENAINQLNGNFIYLQPGVNVLKALADNFSESNPPRIKVEYIERYTNV